MKFKFKKNKKTGEVLVNFSQVKAVDDLRFYLHSSIYEAYAKDITIIIDTNRRKNSLKSNEIEDLINKTDIKYKAYKIESANTSILGFNVSSIGGKKKKQSERMYILNLATSDFTESLFKAVLSGFDIAVGINRKMEFDELCEEVRNEGIGDVLFNNDYFENSIYDSPIALQLRTYVDVSQFANRNG